MIRPFLRSPSTNRQRKTPLHYDAVHVFATNKTQQSHVFARLFSGPSIFSRLARAGHPCHIEACGIPWAEGAARCRTSGSDAMPFEKVSRNFRRCGFQPRPTPNLPSRAAGAPHFFLLPSYFVLPFPLPSGAKRRGLISEAGWVGGLASVGTRGPVPVQNLTVPGSGKRSSGPGGQLPKRSAWVPRRRQMRWSWSWTTRSRRIRSGPTH